VRIKVKEGIIIGPEIIEVIEDQDRRRTFIEL
jgi:hypothetical protein